MIALAAGLEAKDWVSNSIAAIALIATVSLGVWTIRRNRAAQGRQEEMSQAQHDTNSRMVETNMRLAAIMERLEDRSTGHGSAPPSEVEWTLEHASRRRWLLRNLGSGTARAVSIDQDALGGARIDLTPPPPTDLGPGESLSISAIEAWGAPLVDEVRVRWGGNEQVVLALPRWQ